MDETRWAKALEHIRKYAFKIATPGGAGTGFMLTTPNSQGICGIATALHVVDHANQWEQPIRLKHTETGKSIVLHSAERSVFCNPSQDLAVITLENAVFDLPAEDPTLFPEGKHIKPGIQIGWAGYPAVAPNQFSFFSGDVSCFLSDQNAYLVDGVAINGVSGGPAFCVLPENEIHFIGVVTAYVPNRATGENLPGVCYVAGIAPLYHVVKEIKSIDEADEKIREIDAGQDKDSSTPDGNCAEGK